MTMDAGNTDPKLPTSNQCRKVQGLYDLSGRAADEGWSGHLQGIALCAGQRFYITTTAKDGYVLSGIVNKGKSYVFDIDSESLVATKAVHPGGIQAIGDCVAVTVFDKKGSSTRRNSRVEIWRYDPKNQKLRGTKVLALNDLAYTVGIVETSTEGEDRYLLAVGTDKNGKKFSLYASRTMDPGSFKPKGVLSIPDNRGYPNSISLLSHNGDLYFLGLVGKWEERCARLYQLHLLPKPSLQQIGEDLDLQAYYDPSPAWGASARVVNGIVEIVMCSREIYNDPDDGKPVFDVYVMGTRGWGNKKCGKVGFR